MFHNNKMGNFDTSLEGYLELIFIMIRVSNLYTNLGGLF